MIELSIKQNVSNNICYMPIYISNNNSPEETKRIKGRKAPPPAAQARSNCASRSNSPVMPVSRQLAKPGVVRKRMSVQEERKLARKTVDSPPVDRTEPLPIQSIEKYVLEYGARFRTWE